MGIMLGPATGAAKGWRACEELGQVDDEALALGGGGSSTPPGGEGAGGSCRERMRPGREQSHRLTPSFKGDGGVHRARSRSSATAARSRCHRRVYTGESVDSRELSTTALVRVPLEDGQRQKNPQSASET